MEDTFYATLELKNIRMDGFLFSFLGKYRHKNLAEINLQIFVSIAGDKLLMNKFIRQKLVDVLR